MTRPAACLVPGLGGVEIGRHAHAAGEHDGEVELRAGMALASGVFVEAHRRGEILRHAGALAVQRGEQELRV